LRMPSSYGVYIFGAQHDFEADCSDGGGNMRYVTYSVFRRKAKTATTPSEYVVTMVMTASFKQAWRTTITSGQTQAKVMTSS